MFQALPFALKGLIKEEIDTINKCKARMPQFKDEPDVDDPTDTILYVLCLFNDWYGIFRQPMLDTEQLYDAAKKTVHLQEVLKKVFPNKSGMSVLLCCAMLCFVCVC